MSNKRLWNASLGGRFWINDKFNWGTGIFTDRSVNGDPQWVLAENTDRYGIRIGAEIRTPLQVKKESKYANLVWTTTLAMVYTFEIGKVGTVNFYSPIDSEFSTEDVVFHQILFHLGSSLYF